MATRLARLRIDRVDFVDKGANPGAFITLAKRHTSKEQGMAETVDVEKRLADAEAQVIALQKAAEDATKRAETTEALAKKMADDLAVEVEKRATAEAEAISKALVLPGVEDKVAFVKGVRKAENGEAILAVLKTLAVADKTSEVFKELGSDHPSGAEKDGYDRLNQMAEELVAKGVHKTRAIALDAVLKTPEGKAEYEKYVATKTRKGA